MKRRASTRFLGPEDASKIAGVLFALRSGSVSKEVARDLRPDGAFAREIVSALLAEKRQGTTKTAVKPSPAAREAARELRPLGDARPRAKQTVR